MHGRKSGRRPLDHLRRSWNDARRSIRVLGPLCVGLGLHAIGFALVATDGSPAWRALGALGWWAFGLASSEATGRMGRVGMESAPRTHDPAGPRVSRGVGWTVVLAVVAIGHLLRHGSGAPAETADAASVAEAVLTWPGAASAAIFAGLPAVGEESFFRGAGLRWLARRAGPGLACAASAASFACVHPGQILAAAIFGAALAALALATGRTREAIVAHAIHNLLALQVLGLRA